MRHMPKVTCFLIIICCSLFGKAQSDHLVKTSYNFSVTLPKNWKLLSNAEIEKLKEQDNNQNLIMPALAYLGDKKDFDNSPHIYVVYYKQSKLAERGFASAAKIILSDKVRGKVVKELNKRYPKWSFSTNKDEYYIDTDRRLLMFTTSTNYKDGISTVVLYCYFLMETGIAEINFSFDKKVINNYTNLINKVLDTVAIESEYRLKKD